MRTVYARADRPHELLITYEGNASVAGQFPHGNSKRGVNYVMTQPHVLRDAVSAGGSANNTHRKLVTAAGPTQPATATSAPRNTAQIKNALRRHRTAGRLTQDALYNLHEFTYDADFISHISTYPDLEVIMYNKPLMDTFRAILQSSATSGMHSVLLSNYNTAIHG